jgi:DNA repair exonuclease SbcCD ATPase subunit
VISELKIESFGKFARKRFELGKTVLFIGPNESGKTTVFDAFLKALCQPDGRSVVGKELLKRYGPEAEASSVNEEGKEPGRLDVNDFYGIHAVRSGDVLLGTRSPEWMSDLKARLFSSGVDLKTVAKALGEKALSDRRLAHIRSIEDLQWKLEKVQGSLKENNKERENILASELAAKKISDELIKTKEEVRRKEGDLRKLEAELALEEKHVEYRNLKGCLETRLRYEKALAELEKLSRYAKDELADLNKIENTINDRESSVSAKEQELKGILDQANEARAVASRLNAEVGSVRDLAEKARAMIDRLEDAQLGSSTGGHWRAGLVLLGALMLVGGVLSAILIGSNARYIALSIGVVIGGLVLAFSRKPGGMLDPRTEARLVGRFRDEWNRAAPNNRAEVSTISGLTTHLVDVDRAYDVVTNERTTQEHKVADADRKIAELERECRKLREELVQGGQAKKQWLENHNVKSRDEYVSQVSNYKARKGNAEELMALAEGIDRDETERKLNAFDKVGIGVEGKSEAEIQLLRRKVEGLRSEISKLKETVEQQSGRSGREIGHVLGQLKGLPEEIQRLEVECRRFERHLADAHRDMNAAAIAKDLFEELNRESDIQMEEVSGWAQEYLHQILTPDSRVVADDLDENLIEVTDAGGVLRPVTNLSRGTREAFIIAARLALAEHADVGQRVLILDEPFLSLDEERERKAVQMVHTFQEKNDWQVIFLTKQAHIRELVEKTFGGAVVHDLDSTNI